MQQPMVSVLMPVYNGESYLREAIDSILAQTFTDFEFIIINDGSSDGSESIIRSYTDTRIRYVKNEKNLKLIATLNKGLSLCTGKYIARMDADDVAYPQRFERQVAFMEAHPDYGLCGSNIDVNGELKSWVRDGESDFIRFCLLFHNPVCHPTAFIRNEIIRAHQLIYPAEYVHAEEYILWLHILRYSRVANLPEKLLSYRWHPGQVSQVYKDEQFRIGQRIRLELFHEIVLFSTAATRKVHLALAGMVTRAPKEQPFDALDVRFSASYSRAEILSWVRLMKFSLLFRKKWDSPYLRLLIRKAEGAARQKQNEWLGLRVFLSKVRNKIKPNRT